MGDGEPINVTVKAQDGSEVQFRIKSATPFRKVFNAYATKQNLDESQLKFLFDGTRLRGEQTPLDVEMEAHTPLGPCAQTHTHARTRACSQDGDAVDCVLEQIGG